MSRFSLSLGKRFGLWPTMPTRNAMTARGGDIRAGALRDISKFHKRIRRRLYETRRRQQEKSKFVGNPLNPQVPATQIMALEVPSRHREISNRHPQPRKIRCTRQSAFPQPRCRYRLCLLAASQLVLPDACPGISGWLDTILQSRPCDFDRVADPLVMPGYLLTDDNLARAAFRKLARSAGAETYSASRSQKLSSDGASV